MTRLQKNWTLLFVGAFFLTGGCSQKQEAPTKAKTPQISLSCIGVLPVASGVDQEAGTSPTEAKSLKEGVGVFDSLLQKQFAGRDDVRYVTHSQLQAIESSGPESSLSRSRNVGNFLSCNGVLEVNLWRYKDRVGGQYTAKDPASVSFTYRLLEVNSGTVLCQGRYDEVQQSVMENLYNFSSARKRGFTWITAEELLREGVEQKLGECSYLKPVE